MATVGVKGLTVVCRGIIDVRYGVVQMSAVKVTFGWWLKTRVNWTTLLQGTVWPPRLLVHVTYTCLTLTWLGLLTVAEFMFQLEKRLTL